MSMTSGGGKRTGSNRYSDRFIPSRTGSGDLQAAFDLLRQGAASSDGCSGSCENSSASSNLTPGGVVHAVNGDRPASLGSSPSLPSSSSTPSSSSSSSSTGANCYSMLLKSELLDTPMRTPTMQLSSATPLPVPSGGGGGAGVLFNKRPPSLRATPPALHPGFEGVTTRVPSEAGPTTMVTPTNMLRFRCDVERDGDRLQSSDARSALLCATATAPGRMVRKISRVPFKVLDAPCLKDDFYLNLVDWSATNVLSVGLGPCVYLWSACTSVVTKLCDLQMSGPVCSVAWSVQGNQLAVGTSPGEVQIWDAEACKLVRTLAGHSARVGCLAWNSSILSSGGRDKEIFNRDLRCREPFVARLSGHKQEVCGLRWSPDEMQLASGGNDNKLLVWNATGLGCGGTQRLAGAGTLFNKPVLRFSYHQAAVKALAWSPHARGVLASGGGTADRKIRFWNTVTNSALAAVDTGSQVCNLAWSKNVNELVSTHGYSQNQIIVWKYPSLSKIVTLTGHSCRVLYLAMAPSGDTVVTGAGDETLRFWNVFPSAKNQRGDADSSSLLSPGRMSIR